jgi:hypothetical protein
MHSIIVTILSLFCKVELLTWTKVIGADNSNYPLIDYKGRKDSGTWLLPQGEYLVPKLWNFTTGSVLLKAYSNHHPEVPN